MDDCKNMIDSLEERNTSVLRSTHPVKRPVSRVHVGTEVSFHDVSYTVPVKVRGEKFDKALITNVSGILKPGLHAILGPTGSGKTTLLDVLAGRKNRKFLTGLVLINGERQRSDFRLFSGYVVQDDIVMGALTVRENLMFSAALRLPSELGKNEKQTRVDMVINDLGLTKVADSKVGNEVIRGVSGGERKRTSIGMELITSPDVLFLDEPTTGLDAATASSVMQILHSQAKKGRTVIFSIHQPRYTIFKLFDTLTLLSSGKVVFHGDSQQVLPYFEELGFVCESYNNPPDFLLDVIDQEDKSSKASKKMFEYNSLETDEERRDYTERSCGKSLVQRFQESKFYKMTMRELRVEIEEVYAAEAHGIISEDNRSLYPTSFPTQFAVVSRRSLLNLIRNPKTGLAQVGVNLLFAIVIGLIYLRIDLGEAGLQNRVGVFFFLVMSMIFGNMNAVQLFIEERVIFIHECASGYYRVSAYFLAKVFCDILPMRVLPILIFAAVTYWMIGLRSDGIKFLIYSLNLILTSLSSAAVCFAVSSSVKLFALASLLTVLPYIFMMIFSGMLINLKTLTVWLRWLKYFSIFRYSLSNLEINELENLTFRCNTTVHCVTGNEYLHQQGIKVGDLWYNMLAMGCITVILLLIAYIQLRRIKKEK